MTSLNPTGVALYVTVPDSFLQEDDLFGKTLWSLVEWEIWFRPKREDTYAFRRARGILARNNHTAQQSFHMSHETLLAIHGIGPRLAEAVMASKVSLPPERG